MLYTNFDRLRNSVLVMLTHHLALPFLQFVRREEPFPFSLHQLQLLPAGTLGKDLATFLKEKNLVLLPYYARHDVKHILLGYNTTGEGEVSLQCFMMGNRHLSVPVIATVVYGIFTMPEHWRKFIAAYSRGKKAAPIAQWPWFTLMQCKTSELQDKIFKNNKM